MLEDHAGLVSALALAGMTSVLDSTTGYLDRVLRDPATGLYAGSQDADERYYALDALGRGRLEAPYVDGRVFSSWNAALAIAYLDAARRDARPDRLASVRQALDRLFADAYQPGHGLSHGEGVGGQLGDQAWGLWAAVRAYQAGWGTRWLEVAKDLAQHLEDRYADERLGGYFDRAGIDQLGRLDDPVKPMGENSVAAMALIELDALCGEPDQRYLVRARRALESVAALPRQYGLMAAVFARALDRMERPLKITTGSEELAREALLAHPYAVIEPAQDERAIVCVGNMCLAPVSSARALREAIHEATGAGA